MYPFERFTEDAKRSLTLTQEEAERSGHSYIGTEHLLLGLLRLPEGVAPEVLRELGIDLDAVRVTIATVLGRNERILIQQVIPTSRVKKVIEISFEQARRMGENYVDSGHLLMALVIEGEGVAAHVLEDLGASREQVVAAVERRHRLERTVYRTQPPIPPIGEARTVAGFKPVPPPSSDAETLQRLLKRPGIASTLKKRGLDVDMLARELANPPDALVRLRSQLVMARSNLADAVGMQDYVYAAKLQKHIEKLHRRVQEADEAWLRTLGL